MKLYAVTGKDGQILLAYPATQFHNEQSLTLKELHTYDPATQVVVDREVYDLLAFALNKGTINLEGVLVLNDTRISFNTILKFLSSGKEAT